MRARHGFWLGLIVGVAALSAAGSVGAAELRIVVFGAHPDDAEIRAGGTGALWAAQGHHVQLVSVTNGDIGHWRHARRGRWPRARTAEAQAARKILGTTTAMLDIHDGELEPTLENRRTHHAR